MLILAIGTIVLTVTYGLFWHNQPANERSGAQHADENENGLRAALGLKRPRVPAPGGVPREGRSVRGERGDTTQADGLTESATAPGKNETRSNPTNTLKDETAAHFW